MALTKEELEALLLVSAQRPRFTQDSPVFPDVWLAYLDKPADHREDLLLEPHFRARVGMLAKALRELLRGLLPLSSWWRDLLRPQRGSVFDHLEAFARGDTLAPDSGGKPQEVPPPE